MMAAVSSQVPKTLREGNPSSDQRNCDSKSAREITIFFSVSFWHTADACRWSYCKLQQSVENKAQAFWLEQQEGRPREARKL